MIKFTTQLHSIFNDTAVYDWQVSLNGDIVTIIRFVNRINVTVKEDISKDAFEAFIKAMQEILFCKMLGKTLPKINNKLIIIKDKQRMLEFKDKKLKRSIVFQYAEIADIYSNIKDMFKK